MKEGRGTWTTVLCDSLEKVFADSPPRPITERIPSYGFRGETVSVQVAILPPTTTTHHDPETVTIGASTDGPASITISSVELVPVSLPAYENHDRGYLRDTPGLYPDLLRPSPDGKIAAVPGQWRAAWIEIRVDPDAPAATISVTLRLSVGDTEIGTHVHNVTVVPVALPPLEITNTHWFHCDGLANYYGYEVFGVEHWNAIDRFLGSAAAMDVNSILTPVWTPPLDTAVGGTRLPTQLVDIRQRDDGTYSFEFKKLLTWMDLCRKHGITTLEIAHLFTQWGAKATPAIYVMHDDGLRRDFGWDVSATDARYRHLLEHLLPALKGVLSEEWGLNHVVFHISDEPEAHAIDQYRAARAVVEDLLADCVTIDAISDYAFFESGLITHPVVATDAAEPFIAAGVQPLWLYYCIGQHKDVSNRFITLPSSRNRVIGMQLFLAGARGFLHWGFNFYNSYHSIRAIDPFQDTCAGGAFIGGDSFLVYPGPEGVPWPSIRYRVFAEAMADFRLMQLVRDLTSPEDILELLDHDGIVRLDRFPSDANYYRNTRAALAQKVASRRP